MEDNKLIKVSNRTNNTIGYRIPDMGYLYRSYMPKEEKTITFEELRKLRNIPGGKTMIEDYLVIKDKDAIKDLDIHVEPEYFYTEEQVIDLLQNGSLDAFLDCLDFAPDGVLELIKEHAVKLPLNDITKRKAIKDKLDYDVTGVIALNEAMKDVDEKTGMPDKNGRRVQKEEKREVEKAAPTRRVVVKES